MLPLRSSPARFPLPLVLALAVLVPWAWLTNYGEMPIFHDEGYRTLVAAEMVLSGDYLHPTLNAEPYYRKPPVYNWWIAAGFHLGFWDEFSFRVWAGFLPVLLTALLMFQLARREVGREVALLAALMYLAFARMAFYIGLMAFIELLNVVLVLAGFWVIYNQGRKGNWLRLFVGSYFLAGVATLEFGIPNLLYQLGAVGIYCLVEGHLRKLFHWQHVAGIGVYALLVGGYFFAYAQTGGDWQAYLGGIWDQSNQRAFWEYPLEEAALVILGFPFNNLFNHLLPFGLLSLFMFRRAFWADVWSHPWLRFCLVVLLINLPPYWLSPGTHPRYLLALYSLGFFLLAYAAYTARFAFPRLDRALTIALTALLVVLGLGVWAALAFPIATQGVGLAAVKIGLLSAGMFLGAYGLWCYARHRWFVVVAVMLLARLGFMWFGIRHWTVLDVNRRTSRNFAAERVAYRTQGHPLHVFQWTPISEEASFGITRARQTVLDRQRSWHREPGHYYLTEPGLYDPAAEIVLDAWYGRFQDIPILLTYVPPAGIGPKTAVAPPPRP